MIDIYIYIQYIYIHMYIIYIYIHRYLLNLFAQLSIHHVLRENTHVDFHSTIVSVV